MHCASHVFSCLRALAPRQGVTMIYEAATLINNSKRFASDDSRDGKEKPDPLKEKETPTPNTNKTPKICYSRNCSGPEWESAVRQAREEMTKEQPKNRRRFNVKDKAVLISRALAIRDAQLGITRQQFQLTVVYKDDKKEKAD